MTGNIRAPRGAPARAVRLARLLLVPNRLRRPSDRLEGLLVMLLAAVFLVAVAAAPCFAEHLYQSQRADAAQLHAATAVLTQNGPSDNYVTAVGEATARWRAPDGQQEEGVLTTLVAPGITGARAGARVKVWLTDSGQPKAQPLAAAESMFNSAMFAIGALIITAVALLISYWLARLILDRRRLAAWTAEWSLTGPGWTSRR
jgi:ABC-type glycerol-3-phosphate transport system permease component